MGRSYTQDIRGRVTLAMTEGLSRRAAGRRFVVSESSAILWAIRTAREGSSVARKQGRSLGKGPSADHLNFLVTVVEANASLL